MGLDIYLFGVPELLLSYQHSILSEMKKKNNKERLAKHVKEISVGALLSASKDLRLECFYTSQQC